MRTTKERERDAEELYKSLDKLQRVIEMYEAGIITANRAAEKLGCERAYFMMIVDSLERGRQNERV